MHKSHSLAAVALAVAACGSRVNGQSYAGLSRASAATPFANGCVPGGQTGTNFLNAEVEPRLAIDPVDARHLVGVWQQDRWSNGGANGLMTGVSFDGGLTWTQTALPYTVCSGGRFQRASDPWVSFAPDGTVHQIGFGFNNFDFATAMLASRSTDGGRTWTTPITLYGDSATDSDVNIDKESITADPHDATLVYAIWDRLTGQSNPSSPNQTGPAWFARSTNAGVSWETARVIYDPGANTQTISNQIVVLPSGVLLDMLVIINSLVPSSSTTYAVSVLRSADKGVTWSQPVFIATMDLADPVDPKSTSHFIRSGNIVPDIAVDNASGAVYVVWEDGRFSNGLDGIAISKSTNEGVTWSTPVRVNGVATTQAFTPAVAVAQGGAVGVTYYDLRNDNPGDSDHLLATRWLATSHDGGATFADTAMSSTFDIRSAPTVSEGGQSGYFLGDYQGLVSAGTAFLPFFVVANTGNSGNRSDVFARPITSGPAVSESFAPALVAPRRVRGGPRRVF